VVERSMTNLPDTGKAIAALDCGTNSTRLLVVSDTGEILDRQMRVTRLGEGVDTTRKLSSEAIERTLEVLRHYRTTMDRLGVGKARMAATSAARDATNSNEFMSAAEEVTGVVPEILSGDEEGRLSFRGATADLPRSASSTSQSEGTDGTEGVELVVDIGGGSTELVAGVPGAPDHAIKAISLDMGCVRVTERFFSSDPPSAAELEEAKRSVAEELSKVRDSFAMIQPGGRVIGLAGTVSTIGALSMGFEVYERERVHHLVLTDGEVRSWLEQLASEPVKARAARPGMEPGRADVIVGGVLILAAVMATFGRDRCLVSEADILDGMVASLR
jgi:exopolyphosphatase / guanosine-5'-triphosphate,3'-diphosphate pyrophosphatase